MKNVDLNYDTTTCVGKRFNPVRTASLGLVLVAMLVAAPVGAATIQIFALSFAGDRTGWGSFAVDVGGSVCLQTIYDGCNPSMPWYPTTIFYNPVTAFSIDIAEQHYSGMGPGWWLAGSQQPGSVSAGRYQSYYEVFYNQWFTGDPYFGTRHVAMYISAASATGGSGTWNEFVSPEYDPSGVGYYASGTWTATVGSVPIPAAGWLFGSGLLGLWGVARKVA